MLQDGWFLIIVQTSELNLTGPIKVYSKQFSQWTSIEKRHQEVIKD
jgi:hypothetical protein